MFRVEINDPALPRPGAAYGAGQAFFMADSPREVVVNRAYAFPSIGAVVGGTFDYAARARRATASRGAVVFGSGTDEFTVWKTGPQRVHRSVVALDPALLLEIAGDLGSRDGRFPLEVLAPTRATLPLYGLLRRIAAAPGDQTEAVIRLVGMAYGLGREDLRIDVRALDRRRVLDVARELEDRFADPLTLAQMAAMAGLSRYHFIRVFAAATGETPRQRLLALRLRAAADRLIETRAPVTEVALEVGFNDLSHFNAAFRSGFGLSPRAWRRAA